MDIDKIIKNNKARREIYKIKSPKYKKDNIKYFKNLITRILITIILVLGSIIYTNISTSNKELYKKYVLENSLSFTKINNLYEKFLGKVDVLKTTPDYPVFKSINFTNIEPFNNSFKVELTDETVSVLSSGIVVFNGEKEDLGNTVIIQGNDGVDIWYSNLSDINVKVYDYVEENTILGTSLNNYIYLTFNKGDKYLTYEEYINQI